MKAICTQRVQFRGVIWHPGDETEIGEGELDGHIRSSFKFKESANAKARDKTGSDLLSSEEYGRRLDELRIPRKNGLSQDELKKIYDAAVAHPAK